MSLRITTLSENTASRGNLIGEWGLSILLETGNNTILFDTGSSSSTTANADVLGVDFSRINRIVLSHGHYDHTGGMRDVLRRIKKEIEIIGHEDIWQSKYAHGEGEADRFIGIPYQREELETLGARFKLVNEPVEIAEGIITTGEVPMTCDFEKIDPNLYIRENGEWKPDPLKDDLALIAKTKKGLVVLLGCAHRGMINTIYHARELTGTDNIRAVIGGSHLITASEEQLWQTIAVLHEMNVEKLGLCHCTDMAAISVLAQEFGDSFVFNKAGSIIEFD
jgi:7,8-dihydropterin-6-yl-methyl-4-(beta-D-ribofuranosyl)aminobenzene 5'-phosphate synthase